AVAVDERAERLVGEAAVRRVVRADLERPERALVSGRPPGRAGRGGRWRRAARAEEQDREAAAGRVHGARVPRPGARPRGGVLASRRDDVDGAAQAVRPLGSRATVGAVLAGERLLP